MLNVHVSITILIFVQITYIYYQYCDNNYLFPISRYRDKNKIYVHIRYLYFHRA